MDGGSEVTARGWSPSMGCRPLPGPLGSMDDFPPEFTAEDREHWPQMIDCIRSGRIIVEETADHELHLRVPEMSLLKVVPERLVPYLRKWLGANGRRVDVN